RRAAEAIRVPRRDNADVTQYRGHGSHGLQRRGVAGVSVHSGSAGLRDTRAPFEPRRLRGGRAGRLDAGVRDSGELRVSRRDARRDAAATETAVGPGFSRAVFASARVPLSTALRTRHSALPSAWRG